MNPNSPQKRIAFGNNREANGKVVLHEGQAATVNLIFSYYLEGKSLSEIKEILDRMGIISPQNRSGWGKQTISNILKNPHYLGSDVYPQIISEDVFMQVQTLMTDKRK